MNDYYLFGLTLNSYSRENGRPNYYKYNGKELQDEINLGWLDYGARMYDPAVARWIAIDPLADLSRKWSPYTYGYNNPIRFIDPTGMYSTEAWKKDNGITDDDLLTVYQANSSSDNEESNEFEDQEAKPVTPASKDVQDLTSPGGIKQMQIIKGRQAEYYQNNPGVLLQHIKDTPHAFILYYKILERYMPDNVDK